MMNHRTPPDEQHQQMMESGVGGIFGTTNHHTNVTGMNNSNRGTHHIQGTIGVSSDAHETRVDTVSNFQLQLPSAISQLGERNPFKCPSCGVDYSSSLTSENVPCYLKSCTHTMCIVCVEKNREVKETSNRISWSINCAICQKTSISNGISPIRAYSFIDILIEIKAKVTSNESIEIANVLALKCQYCKTTYSSISQSASSPRILTCGDAMCANCMEVNKEERSEKAKKKHNPSVKYLVRCPSRKCRQFSSLNETGCDLTIHDVLLWLERRTVLNNQFPCADCSLLTPCNRGFVCIDCTNKDGGKHRMLCGFCTSVLHKVHTFETIPNNLNSMKQEYVELETKFVNRSSEAKSVLDRSKALRHVERIEKFFSCVVRTTLPMAKTYGDVVTIASKLKGKADEFGDIMKTIISQNKAQNKRLEDMMKKFAEDFLEVERPQLTVVIEDSEDSERVEEIQMVYNGESEGDEENAEKKRDDGDSKGKEDNPDKRKMKEEQEDVEEVTERKRPKVTMKQNNVRMKCESVSNNDNLPFQY